MREILFRGKRIDNGEWIKGTLYQISTKLNPFIMITNRNAESHEVDTETVGQFTWLTDKNGKRIFEGDILHICKIADGIDGYYHPPIDYHVNVVVKWDLCAWMWEKICDDNRYIIFPDAWCHYDSEVIGNIHDNPELLEDAE